jgi:uncharacterized protein (DUF1499 family)
MRISSVPMLIWLPLALLALVLLIFLAGQLGFLRGTPPDDLGVHDGKLKAPSNTENSVTSQADLYPQHPLKEYADIAAIELQNADGPATLVRIGEILDSMEGAEVVETAADYLHAQFTSKGLKFVDDAEFWFDPDQNVIHVRSAARLGRKDFGMNRQHIEAVRAALRNE